MRLNQCVLSLVVFSVLNSTAVFAATGLNKSAACTRWSELLGVSNESAAVLHSDQVTVLNQSGESLFSWTDQVYKSSSPHQLWSVSKTITAAIIGASILRDKIQLASSVSQLLPVSVRKQMVDVQRFSLLTFAHLLSMTSGISWIETQDVNLQSITDFPMMYADNDGDFAKFIVQRPFTNDPGEVWNYATANANLAMAALKSVYGAGYDTMPWDLLFTPAHMSSARFSKTVQAHLSAVRMSIFRLRIWRSLVSFISMTE